MAKKKTSVSGTKEWAKRSVNICRGCIHACLYCYGRGMGVRFRRTTAEDWPDEIIVEYKVEKEWRHVEGTIMFPTTHDITPKTLDACEKVLVKILAAGNKVLIVSKPHRVCIQRLIERLAQWKDQILFRFTIGVRDDVLRRFWEPGAPDFAERLECLQMAFDTGYQTSVSMEPLLEPWNVKELVETVRPFVTDSVWIGKANNLRQLTSWILPADHPEILRLLSWQTDEKVREIYDVFRQDPLIKWKESYKDVVGIDRPTDAGLDV